MDIYAPTKVALDLSFQRCPKADSRIDEINVKDFPGETAAFYDSLTPTALLYVAFRL